MLYLHVYTLPVETLSCAVVRLFSSLPGPLALTYHVSFNYPRAASRRVDFVQANFVLAVVSPINGIQTCLVIEIISSLIFRRFRSVAFIIAILLHFAKEPLSMTQVKGASVRSALFFSARFPRRMGVIGAVRDARVDQRRRFRARHVD